MATLVWSLLIFKAKLPPAVAKVNFCFGLGPDPLAGRSKPCANFCVGKPYFIYHLLTPLYER